MERIGTYASVDSFPKSFLACIFSEIVIWNVSEGLYSTVADQMDDYLCYRKMWIGSANFFPSKCLWTCRKSVWTECERCKVRQTFSHPTVDLKAFCDTVRKWMLYLHRTPCSVWRSPVVTFLNTAYSSVYVTRRAYNFTEHSTCYNLSNNICNQC